MISIPLTGGRGGWGGRPSVPGGSWGGETKAWGGETKAWGGENKAGGGGWGDKSAGGFGGGNRFGGRGGFGSNDRRGERGGEKSGGAKVSNIFCRFLSI